MTTLIRCEACGLMVEPKRPLEGEPPGRLIHLARIKIERPSWLGMPERWELEADLCGHCLDELSSRYFGATPLAADGIELPPFLRAG